MAQTLDFTGAFELRRPGDTSAQPPVLTFSASGQITIPDGALPTPAPPGPVPGSLGSRVRLGAFVYRGIPGTDGSGDPWDPNPHFELEKALGRRLSPVSCFLGWDTDFPAAQFAAYGDRDLLISWHPDVPPAADILAGRWNTYLDRWATAVDRYNGGQVYIRLMPEMNGSWSRWSPAYTGSNPMGITSTTMYVQVWRYVVSRVRARTTRVKWVFCPNITDEPAWDGNRLEQFYPGNTYVDVLGFDGYNWGDSGAGTHLWTPFADLLGKPQGGASRSIYDRLAALRVSVPIWVCEFGCKEPARDDGKQVVTSTAVTAGLAPPSPTYSKARWYADALRLTGFDRLTTLVAFDVMKERDWRLQSSPDVVAAIAANLAV